MGRRIRAAIEIIQEMRRTTPRYSFEHAVANILLGLAGFVLILLGEHELWWVLFAVLLVSIAVQGFRAWRFMRQRGRN